MSQDYDYAKSVLQDLGYTIAEASEIIDEIKQGNYAFFFAKKQSLWVHLNNKFGCKMSAQG